MAHGRGATCQLQPTASNAKRASRVTRFRRAGVVLAVSGEEAQHSIMLLRACLAALAVIGPF